MIIPLILSVIATLTILGNLFVIVSVILKDQLRRVRSNLFVVSLGKSSVTYYTVIIKIRGPNYADYKIRRWCILSNFTVHAYDKIIPELNCKSKKCLNSWCYRINIFSAVTDILVGAIAMPFTIEKLHLSNMLSLSNTNGVSNCTTNCSSSNATQSSKSQTPGWQHNDGVCIIWIFADVVACTASIWNLAIIAFDRLLVNDDLLFHYNAIHV